MKIETVSRGSNVLRKKTEPIKKIDDEVKDLADKMTELLIRKGAYGIAGPQAGISKRIAVVDVEDYFQVLINPEIVEKSEESESIVEGCLSVPGVNAEVERAKSVVVRSKDLKGNAIKIEAKGMLARVLQHEIDHLNGVLFIDHLGTAKRNQLLKEYERMKNNTTKGEAEL